MTFAPSPLNIATDARYAACDPQWADTRIPSHSAAHRPSGRVVLRPLTKGDIRPMPTELPVCSRCGCPYRGRLA